MIDLQSDIKFLPGVGPKKAKIINEELQIFVVEDFLYHFPYRYIDRTKYHTVSEINTFLPYIQSKGIIKNMRLIGQGRKQRMVADFTDDTGTMELCWFKGVQWISKNITSGKEYVIFGKATKFGSKVNIVHPEAEEASKHENKLASSLEATYHTSDKAKKGYVNSKTILKITEYIFKNLETKIPETLPAYLIKELKIFSHNEAMRNIHFPKDNLLLKQATYRLKFEELFYIQLSLLKEKKNRKTKFRSYKFELVGNYFNNFFKNNLPFELTGAQKRVLKELRNDFGTGKQSNRLLQGDVGSGKTLVALMSMLIALDNGFQAAMMAPTEILAGQHLETITDFLKGLNINVALLTGSTKTKARRELHEALESGEIHILIGTHALIEDKVKFKNLGLVIIDEQHRFGVAQRSKMWKKNTLPPHIIVMTATPIPRTLAMTVYGDLDVSVIDELPPGRKSVKTYHAYDSQRLRVFKFMKKQIALGRQIYIVYPLIQESENFDYKDLEDGLESISRAFPPPEYSISVVHGRMKPEEKQKSMQLFAKGITKIMIATTVIEVGVNIPNASVMIIESAERFGLSQLHQLRGRVGRGNDQSYCILMTSYKLSADGRKRIQTMVETNDGFKISEADLRLRGPGDIRGTQQSGIPFDLKISNLVQDTEILQYARNVATDILENDPKLTESRHSIFNTRLKKLRRGNKNWSVVS